MNITSARVIPSVQAVCINGMGIVQMVFRDSKGRVNTEFVCCCSGGTRDRAQDARDIGLYYSEKLGIPFLDKTAVHIQVESPKQV